MCDYPIPSGLLEEVRDYLIKNNLLANQTNFEKAIYKIADEKLSFANRYFNNTDGLADYMSEQIDAIVDDIISTNKN